MPSINDWARKAADYIESEYCSKPRHPPTVDRVAAIIATFAEPLMKALRDSKQEHYHCDDSFYCCPQCDCISRGCTPDLEPTPNNSDKPCTCGADAENARIDAVLAGNEWAEVGMIDASGLVPVPITEIQPGPLTKKFMEGTLEDHEAVIGITSPMEHRLMITLESEEDALEKMSEKGFQVGDPFSLTVPLGKKTLHIGMTIVTREVK